MSQKEHSPYNIMNIIKNTLPKYNKYYYEHTFYNIRNVIKNTPFKYIEYFTEHYQ